MTVRKLRKPTVEQGQDYCIAYAVKDGPLWFPLDELAMYVSQQNVEDYGGYCLSLRGRFYRKPYIVDRLLTAGIPGVRLDVYLWRDNQWIVPSRDHWGAPIVNSDIREGDQ